MTGVAFEALRNKNKANKNPYQWLSSTVSSVDALDHKVNTHTHTHRYTNVYIKQSKMT